MSAKYIFVTGGVVSGLGKGITAASLGRLLKSRGLRVTMQKLDPYLNFDPGIMDPIQHGEVFVTDDGAETDLDLGHYERFIDENLTKHSTTTSGRIYYNVIMRERKGDYKGRTVQVIPHITNEIKKCISYGKENVDIAIVEIGGTVGDIESLPYIEAIRQFSADVGKENCLFVHVTLLPYISASKELKTKPTQHSVKELLSIGIQPDIIVLRSEHAIDSDLKKKIALFCNVREKCVIENLDLPLLYEVPLALAREGLDDTVCEHFNLCTNDRDMSEWTDMVNKTLNLKETVKIALVGKYIALNDSYLSIVEALKHGGIENGVAINIIWVDAEELCKESCSDALKDVDGIIVPSGFGKRGIEGKICAAKYARENNIPYFGIALGMHTAIIEYARNVLGYDDANSIEVDQYTNHPVIDWMQNGDENSSRKGLYPCKLKAGTKVFECYNKEMIFERHRHKNEVSSVYRDKLEEAGIVFSGISPDERYAELFELPEHIWYIGCQFNPEFRSRPTRPHPLFYGFIKAVKKYKSLK